MNRSRYSIGLAAAFAMTVGVLTCTHAQTPTTQRPPSASQGPGAGSQGAGGVQAWKASDIIGQNVYTTDDQEKGKIKDLMIGQDGKIVYAAVSFGGFAGIGDKLFAVPMDAIHMTWKDGKLDKARVDVTEQNINQRQGFNEDRWPQQADRGFMAGNAPATSATK